MFEEYIRRSSEISKLNLFPDESMSDSEFISHLYKTSARIQSLCQANQRQLSEEIEPLFKNPESLTEEQQKEIESFAQALTKTSGCDDIYISQKAYEVLLYCARKQGNVGQIIKQLYNCGITYYQWMREKQLSLADEGIKTSYKNRFFFDMEAYMAKWKETVFDAETMDYLIRGYANRLLGLRPMTRMSR